MEAEADGGPDRDHQPDDEQVPDGVGGDPAGEDRRRCHGQGAEPVDHAAGEVFGDGDTGLGGAEADGEHEDAGKQVVDVVGDARRVDGPSEDVGE